MVAIIILSWAFILISVVRVVAFVWAAAIWMEAVPEKSSGSVILYFLPQLGMKEEKTNQPDAEKVRN